MAVVNGQLFLSVHFVILFLFELCFFLFYGSSVITVIAILTSSGRRHFVNNLCYYIPFATSPHPSTNTIALFSMF